MDENKIDISWINEKRQISELLPADYNPRKLSDTQKEQLKTSLSKFNLADPLIINLNNKVIGGHQRLIILAELEILEVDVRVPNRLLTTEEEKELNLRLNKNNGDWEWGKLLDNFQFDVLAEVGFSEKEISDQMDFKNLLGDKENDEEFDVDQELKKIVEPKIKKGDIFILGKNRVMCGDSVDLEDVQKLMKEQTANLIFTDPPYNVNYKGAGENTSEGIKNDHMTPEQFEDFMSKVFIAMNSALSGGGGILCWPRGGQLPGLF